MEVAERSKVTLYGTERPAASFRLLTAGKLEARLEAGNLRYVTFGGYEVLRAITYVIRDENWGTLVPDLEDVAVEQTATSFRVTYTGCCETSDATLRYHAEILGDAEGTLRFSATATPDGDFLTNRCGFTVLHPIEGVAGAPVTVEHVDGSIVEAQFPKLIDPWQPFKDIRALTHGVAGRFRATCRLEGAAFEMEDHRNWSDASFKTYVRPLALPWPYVMKSQEEDRQEITLSVQPDPAGAATVAAGDAAGQGPVSIAVGPPQEPAQHHPEIGLVVAPEEVEETLAALEVVKAVGPQVILCHFDPTAGHGPEAMEGFARLQKVSLARYLLECVVAARGDLETELAGVAQAVARAGLQLSAVAVCPSVDRQSTPPGSDWPACPPLAEIYAAARAAFPELPLGGGMFSYFTELNRKRPPVELLDFVTHGTCPIVHAADDESVMETLEALPHITASARAIVGGEKRYHIGPSTIAMRQNPYGAHTMANPHDERICMARRDPRHFGLFGAAWTIGYAARISSAAPALYVPAAATGPRGLLCSPVTAGRRQSRTAPRLSPVIHAAGLLAEIAGGEVRPCQTSDPRRVAAVAATTAAGLMIVVANLTAAPSEVTLSGLPEARSWAVEILDESSWDPGAERVAPRRQVAWQGGAIVLESFALAVFRE